MLDEVAAETLDLALCMSVNPGWGGQKFIGDSLDKLERMRPRSRTRSRSRSTAGSRRRPPTVRQAGANLLVTGSAVFGADDPAAASRGSPKPRARPSPGPSALGRRQA